jgi:hypothetical protein
MAYFAHSIGGVPLDLDHLEPRTLAFHVEKVGRVLAIDVRFSNHTFTVAFEEGVHDPAYRIMDHNRPRAYDPERHALSHGLPAMIEALPGAAVHLTRSDRNYVYFAATTTAAGQHYPMFFGLRRSPSNGAHQLRLTVESAYPVVDRRAVLEGSTKVSFPVLCAKVYRGERVQPRARR